MTPAINARSFAQSAPFRLSSTPPAFDPNNMPTLPSGHRWLRIHAHYATYTNLPASFTGNVPADCIRYAHAYNSPAPLASIPPLDTLIQTARTQLATQIANYNKLSTTAIPTLPLLADGVTIDPTVTLKNLERLADKTTTIRNALLSIAYQERYLRRLLRAQKNIAKHTPKGA